MKLVKIDPEALTDFFQEKMLVEQKNVSPSKKSLVKIEEDLNETKET